MFRRVFKKFGVLFNLIKEGKIKYIFNFFIKQISSQEKSFGFKRDLRKEFKAPRSLVKITTRVANDNDDAFFDDNFNNGLIYNFHTCYVGVNKDEIPCARLWIIDASQKDKIKEAWGESFPPLTDDEVFFENIFTIPKFRGLGIIPIFMHQLSEIAKKTGANYAITFGAIRNTATSRSYDYAGFEPYVIRNVRWSFFKKTVTYEEIPEDLMAYYNKVTRRKLKSKKTTT